MNDFIADVEHQYEVYCKVAEDHGFIDLNAKKNGFRCTTKSNEFNAGWVAFVGAVAAVRDEQKDKIDHLTTMNQRYIGKMQEQQDQITELEKQIGEISSYATELAEYTSYAEIIGSVLHNRKVIREYCDKIFAYNRAVDAEEEKALRGEHE